MEKKKCPLCEKGTIGFIEFKDLTISLACNKCKVSVKGLPNEESALRQYELLVALNKENEKSRKKGLM